MFFTVNHVATTSRPRALSIGPLTGQKSSFQLSAATGVAAVHFPFSRRDTAISRTSSSVRSLNAVSTPSAVATAVVGQHSQTLWSISTSEVCFQPASNDA